jgi:LacI family transcriptional regulator
MAVTMTELARAAGVNQSTVSLVLNGKARQARISEKRARQILELAEKLNYRPNLAARSTRMGRFNSISLILSPRTSASNLPIELIEGIEAEMVANSLTLNLSMMPDASLIDTWGVPNALSKYMCDGLLINYNLGIPPELIERIAVNRTPAIWINAKREADWVGPDDHQAGYELTKRMLAAGHKRVAFVEFSYRWPNPPHYSATDRYAGYAQAMKEAGLPVQLLTGSSADSDANGDRRRVVIREAFADPRKRPTAIVAYAFSHIMIAACVLAEMGLKLPEDVSLATFDSHELEFFSLPVTTAIVPNREVGAQATRLLLEKIKDPTRAFDPIVVPFTIADGQTIVPPR